ncbi:MAG: precorrin-6Y C5,15-methyltransferase (decarboxylating) subunit CbiT [Bacillota bacterium]
MKIIKDSEFIKGKSPMTKEEVRTITLSKLQISSNDNILDIGGGTGSIAISLAINTKGNVTTIEKDKNACNLIKRNKEKFRCDNLKVIQGLAPKDLDKKRVDKIFVGGTYGKMKEIFNYLDNYLLKEGVVVLNFITIENTYKALEELKKRNYKDLDITQVTISKGKFIKDITMMKTNNTITIIKAKKG